MNLIRPYGETAQSLSVAEGDRERRDVARRLISQSADMCLMCACALDSAVIEGGGLPLGTEAASVSQASRAVSMEFSSTRALTSSRARSMSLIVSAGVSGMPSLPSCSIVSSFAARPRR